MPIERFSIKEISDKTTNRQTQHSLFRADQRVGEI